MEEAIELANYLPLSFKTPAEKKYIEFLWDAFETNYKHEKYQFAFLAYHMITMSFIYFKIWQIKQGEPTASTFGTARFRRRATHRKRPRGASGSQKQYGRRCIICCEW